MRIHLLPSLILAAAILSGCGLVYTNIHSPRGYRSATPADVKVAPDDPTVTGRSCSRAILYTVAWGDSGYAAATARALEGKPGLILYDVKSDIKVTAIGLGLYTEVCTIVTGKAGRP
ncbi:MAG: hypothetical protein A2X36_01105 [Elusimicrobia bacterium GWA2_69_24]|nr:MAG: hypothetical protein A2X36_01105 [Elusimicrobia bacterium GWA2_69_24]HBL16465.1 hypothetical protein [Elusimicrobiota bacterium]